MNKFIIGLRYFLYKLFIKFHYLGWKVIFKKNVVILNPCYIHLGNYVNIDSYCILSVIKDSSHYIQAKPVIMIEDNVGIGQGTLIYAIKSVHIKKNSMVGPYCFIGDYDHAYEDINKPIVHQPLYNVQPITIEEGVWIGVHVTICSGVTIGRNAVVGAGSVVIKDIPPFSLAGGVPARVIKKYNRKTKKWDRVRKK